MSRQSEFGEPLPTHPGQGAAGCDVDAKSQAAETPPTVLLLGASVPGNRTSDERGCGGGPSVCCFAQQLFEPLPRPLLAHLLQQPFEQTGASSRKSPLAGDPGDW